jgi:selenide,water dikinase
VLTKPIGTGLIATAIKRGIATALQRDAAVAVMTELNDAAMRAMVAVGVHAATDVTGFGLLGHLGEMLGDAVGAEIDAGSVPVLDGGRHLAAGGVIPGGTRRNLEHAAGFTDFGDLDDADRLVLADAQTSGGLLIAVPEARTEALLAALSAEGTPASAVIGGLTAGHAGRVTVR